MKKIFVLLCLSGCFAFASSYASDEIKEPEIECFFEGPEYERLDDLPVEEDSYRIHTAQVNNFDIKIYEVRIGAEDNNKLFLATFLNAEGLPEIRHYLPEPTKDHPSYFSIGTRGEENFVAISCALSE